MPPSRNSARANTRVSRVDQSRFVSSTTSFVAMQCQVSNRPGFAAPNTAGENAPTFTPPAASRAEG